MAINANRPSVFIGRIVPVPSKAVVRAAGSSASRRQARLEIACTDGKATGTCRGRIRLNIPNGPTVARWRFRLAADETKTVVVPIGRRGRRSIRARGNRRLIAVAEMNDGRTAKRRLALVPG